MFVFRNRLDEKSVKNKFGALYGEYNRLEGDTSSLSKWQLARLKVTVRYRRLIYNLWMILGLLGNVGHVQETFLDGLVGFYCPRDGSSSRSGSILLLRLTFTSRWNEALQGRKDQLLSSKYSKKKN